MNLFLIRHGRSLANEQKLVTGNTADVLSPEGVSQVEDLKVWLNNIGVVADQYITSQWQRAQQTANILRSAEKWVVTTEVGETDAGEVNEWKLCDFLLQYPDFYQSPKTCYPGGESHNQLYNRTTHWLNNLLKNSAVHENVMLVAHSGPISCLLQRVANVSMDSFPAFSPSNASLSIINFVDNDIDKGSIMGVSLCSEKMIAKQLGLS
ncbi:MAG: histidine phosphatase family protein [Methylococcales bacterium]